MRRLLARFWRSLRTDRATRWRTAFLGLTALVIGMEVAAAADGDDQTDPWTDLVVRHVPAEVTGLAIGGLSLWLVIHFGVRYLRKHRAGKRTGMGGE